MKHLLSRPIVRHIFHFIKLHNQQDVFVKYFTGGNKVYVNFPPYFDQAYTRGKGGGVFMTANDKEKFRQSAI